MTEWTFKVARELAGSPAAVLAALTQPVQLQRCCAGPADREGYEITGGPTTILETAPDEKPVTEPRPTFRIADSAGSRSCRS